MTTIDLHLRLASRISLSWSTRSIPVRSSSIFHRGPCPRLSSSCLCSASSARVFVIMSRGRARSLSEGSMYSQRIRFSFRSTSSLLFWASSRLRCISSIRFLASSSYSLLVRSSPTKSLIISLYLSSCFSSMTATSTILYNSVSLFALSLQLLFHMLVFSVTAVPTASNSAEISVHFPFD